ncbi:transglycosylase domain-containing protein [Gryllotalpicola protaetiae]|uniref:PASTA domain-containing protein n=1 Tax=Gryllotalpicola protaetiae TaxID=2419771 RepID=A0A387BQ44_9MICO|nr:transglycosylase domain-containing protein [Gryllotalpicola protaetiae]AYG04194.1 PASTA domain-containing protein [Gryllotalpicola protaetiae]
MSARKLTARGVLGGLLGFVAMSAVAGLLVAAAVTPAVAVTGMAANNSIGVFQGLPEYLKIDSLATRSTMYAKQGGKDVPIATFYSQNRIVDTWDQINQITKDAAVSTEDPRFYSHGAIDVQGTTRALVNDLLNKSGETQGGSSITQQYVKNVRLQTCEKYNVLPDDTGTAEQQQAAQAALTKKYQDCYNSYTDATGLDGLSRKVQEMKLAIGVEKKYNKQDILLGYLNIAGFGGQVYGIESAARYYFNTTAAQLNLQQAATLIAIVNNPNNLRIDLPNNKLNGTANGFKATLDRRNYVLRSMLKAKTITQQQYDDAVKTKIEPTITPQPSGCAQAAGQDAAFYCDAVMYEIQHNPVFGKTQDDRDALLNHGGLNIYTALNLDLQSQAQQALSSYIPPSDPRFNIGGADVSVELNTGRVVLAVQNRPFNPTTTSQGNSTQTAYTFDYNHGGSSGFQTGSTYKAFSLVEWLKAGHALNDIVNAPVSRATIPQSKYHSSCDTPNGPAWQLKNDESGEGGPMTVLKATALSINTAFAVMGEQFDLCSLRNDAAALGVKPAYPYEQQYNSKGVLVNVTDANGKPVPAQLADNPSSILGTNYVSPLDMAVAYAGIANGGKTCSPIYIDKVTDATGKDLPVPQTTCTQAIDPKIAAGVTYALANGPLVGSGTGAAANPKDGVPIMGKTGTANGKDGEPGVQNWLVTSTTKVANATWVGNVSGNYAFQDLTFNHVQGRNVKFPIAKSILTNLDKTYGGDAFPTPDALSVNGPQVGIPDLSGKTPQQAQQVLEGLGFVFADGGPQPGSQPAGTVQSTNPPAGSKLSKGSTVTIYESDGSQVLVPDVTGKKLTDAVATLMAAGLTPQVPGGVSDPNGTVTAENPGANTPVNKGTAVQLQVQPSGGAGGGQGGGGGPGGGQGGGPGKNP